jgi:hypothetical protein
MGLRDKAKREAGTIVTAFCPPALVTGGGEASAQSSPTRSGCWRGFGP